MKLFCSIAFSLLLSLNAWGLNDNQVLFLQAEAAMQAGDFSQYKKYHKRLKQHVLLPYLEFEYLNAHLDQQPIKQIKAFQEKYANTAIAKRLQANWLNYLGAQQEWPLFDQFYQAEQAYQSHQCLRLESQLQRQTIDKSAFLEKVALMWQKPYSLPKQCDTIFDVWRKAGPVNQGIAWQRFESSYNRSNTRLARYLIRYLSDEQKLLADELLQADKHAEIWLERLAEQSVQLSSTANKLILRHLSRVGFYPQVAELIKTSPAWLSSADLIELRRVMAWHYARESGLEAIAWIHSLDNKHGLDAYLLRYAMQERDWAKYMEVFAAADSEFQQADEWLYWYAIAQEKTSLATIDEQHNASAILSKLAQQRSFYGFLAAEKLGAAIQIYTSKPEFPESLNQATEKALALPIELFLVGKLQQANQEWFWASKQFNQEQWIEAGLISHHAGWHDKSIQAFAKAQLWDAIEQRFPLAWQQQFEQQAKDKSLEASWLFAMARQESGFSALARSNAGAMGVLQLMPQTARQVANSNGFKLQLSDLYQADINIALGSSYLKQLLERFGNNYILATAAYNAGPHRVDEWLETRPFEADNWIHWVANIPFPETRQYVQNILTYSRIYQNLIGSKATSLSLAQNTTAKPTQLASTDK